MTQLQNNLLHLKTIRGTDENLYCKAYVTPTVNVDGVVRKICLYVLDRIFLDAEVLIGQNFTELDDIKYVNSGQLLRFSEETQINISIRSGKIDSTLINVENGNSEFIHKVVNILNNFQICVVKSAYAYRYHRNAYFFEQMNL